MSSVSLYTICPEKTTFYAFLKIGTDNNDLSISHDSITTNYRLQDITDVHIRACLQEASEYMSLSDDQIFTILHWIDITFYLFQAYDKTMFLYLLLPHPEEALSHQWCFRLFSTLQMKLLMTSLQEIKLRLYLPLVGSRVYRHCSLPLASHQQ